MIFWPRSDLKFVIFYDTMIFCINKNIRKGAVSVAGNNQWQTNLSKNNGISKVTSINLFAWIEASNQSLQGLASPNSMMVDGEQNTTIYTGFWALL